ncbi:MAG TPA: peptide chain release factor N(5)-glutamine methyltransferase [Candidatus Saccharimonadaceae bacterium]|nr:peptide chain release factor N(5)-glutamine methyltransferase [Candidatus Saccharimonadaceae bacterium]
MTIIAWLRDASTTLADHLIPSARLDAEIILAHTINRPRTWLHAHGDDTLDPRRMEIANARVRLRLDYTPIAYIIGHKEFYGRRFYVTPSTLIPRPESEALINLLKKRMKKSYKTCIDVGAGSGCLGITAKLEYPKLNVTLSDVDRHALHVAERNANACHATVETIVNSLLPPGSVYDIIIANLPYVDKTWYRNEETNFEPGRALFAPDGGLALIKKLINQTKRGLAPGGLLLLEADPRQHGAVTDYATKHNLSLVASEGYALAFTR